MIEHEQYYRKGGTYELPIEIYNDLIGQIEEAQKERNDYKQRNEKAIEICEKWLKLYKPLNSDERLILRLEEQINILNGSDDE